MTTHAAEIDEDLGRERVEWRVQRIVWVVLLLFVASAAAGLTGPGPWSSTQTTAGAVTLEHDRILHRLSPTELEVTVDPAPAGALHLELAGSWVETHRIEQVLPAPSESQSAPGRLSFEFPPAESAAVRIRLRVQAERVGRCEARLDVGGESLPFDVTVLP